MASVVEIKQVDSKKCTLPLEQALSSTGGKKYLLMHSVACGLVLFSALCVILLPSYVIPTADCDLNFTSSQKGLLASAGYTGMIFSSHLVGYLADRYGRRTVVMACCGISSLLTLLVSFTTQFWQLYLVWLLNGLHCSGIVSPTYVYIAEMVPVPFRATALLISSSISSLALTFLPGLAWSVLPLQGGLWGWSPWRLLVMSVALLPLLCCLMLLMLPESPKFLLSSGRPDRALAVLRRIYVFNTRQHPQHFQVDEVCLDAEDEVSGGGRSSNLLDFFKSLWRNTVTLVTPPLLPYTLLASLLQLAIVSVFNVLMLLLPDTVNRVTSNIGPPATICSIISSGSVSSVLPEPSPCLAIHPRVYLTNIFIGLSQFLFFICASYVTPIIGPKNILIGNLLVGSLFSCLLTMVKEPLLIYGSMAVIINMTGAALPLAVSIAVGFYPTHIRSMGTSMFMVCGRLGVVAATQFFSYIQQVYCDASYYSLTVILAGTGFLTFLVPVQKK